MIIFGTRGVGKTLDSGYFDCPQCEHEEAYKYKSVRRFFTLYFIPLIPLNHLGEYVECQRCKGTFIKKVLDYQSDDGEAFMSQYERAIRHCMVMIMLADGAIENSEMRMVMNIINKYSHNDITLDELNDLIDDIEDEGADISTYLRDIKHSLNEHAKEVLIRCALDVAGSDGHIDPSELNLINRMAGSLDMSKAHLKGILSDWHEERPTFFYSLTRTAAD